MRINKFKGGFFVVLLNWSSINNKSFTIYKKIIIIICGGESFCADLGVCRSDLIFFQNLRVQ